MAHALSGEAQAAQTALQMCSDVMYYLKSLRTVRPEVSGQIAADLQPEAHVARAQQQQARRMGVAPPLHRVAVLACESQRLPASAHAVHLQACIQV